MKGRNPTLEQIIASLQESSPATDDYLSTEEWAEHFGLCTRSVQLIMRRAQQKGVLMTGRRHSTSIDGKAIMSPVYKFATQEIKDVLPDKPLDPLLFLRPHHQKA
jgi:hypothetical protein